MIALVLATALSTAPVKLAAPGFQGVNIRNELTFYFTSEFNNRLREQGLEVVSEKDIAILLGIERQKELMGCAGEENCIAELANALGVDGVITGSVAKLGDGFRVLITVVSSANAKPLATWSGSAEGQKEVYEALAEAASQMAPQILSALHREPIRISTPGAPQSRRGQWGFVAAGGALGFAGISAGLFTVAGQYDGFLKCDVGQPCALTPQQAQTAHDNGQLMQGLAIGAAVAAAICVGLAIWLFVQSE